ncbi:MAG: DUF3516 domain-containing protein [Slackia sp.]
MKKKKPPEGFVNWNEDTFVKLIDAAPETLKPRMRITHSMVLAVVSQGGDAWTRVRKLIDDSAQTPEEKVKLYERADEVFMTLIDADVVEKIECEDGSVNIAHDGSRTISRSTSRFPFLLAALELLDERNVHHGLDSGWRPRWKTRVRCCVRKSAKRARRPWPR